MVVGPATATRRHCSIIFNLAEARRTGRRSSSAAPSNDLGSAVLLIDSSFPNYFAQAFTPGSSLNFLLELTTNLDDGIPDEFTFSILDKTLTPIPTVAGALFDVFVQIDIDSSSPTITTYPSDGSRAPDGG